MKTELLAISVLSLIGVAFAVSPAEVVAQSRNLNYSDFSLLTGGYFLPLSGVSPYVFDTAAFVRGSSDSLSNYYTPSMMAFLNRDNTAGSPNIVRKGAMIGLLNENSADNIGE